MLAQDLGSTQNDLQSVVKDNQKILSGESLSVCGLMSALNIVVGDLEDYYKLKNPSKTQTAVAGAAAGAAGAHPSAGGGAGGGGAGGGGGNGAGTGTDICSASASNQ